MAHSEKKVGVVGSYDGDLHPGHIHFLRKARRQGNQFHIVRRTSEGRLQFFQRSQGELYVFVVPDEIIRRNKNREPVYTQVERVKHLYESGIPTHVIALQGTEKEQLQQIFGLQPHVWARTPDQQLPFDEAVDKGLRRFGARILTIQKFHPERYSTTKIHFSQQEKQKPLTDYSKKNKLDICQRKEGPLNNS